jgi:SNF2 family DNA or RNA helicase
MNQAQTEAYEAMEEMLFIELEGVPVTARVAAAKLLKLREITGGFIIADDKREIPLGADAPKMIELDTLLEQSIADKMGDEGPPNKAIIWAQYQWECKTLIKRYGKRYGAKGLFGGISNGAKDAAIKAFKHDDACRVLVCHPASAGHGLTLVEANYIFYYSLSYNFEEFYQSYRRTARAGQRRAMFYYFLICPGTIDEELKEAIRAKKNLSDLITDGQFNREELIGKRGERPVDMPPTWEVPDATPARPPQREPAGQDPPDPARDDLLD